LDETDDEELEMMEMGSGGGGSGGVFHMMRRSKKGVDVGTISSLPTNIITFIDFYKIFLMKFFVNSILDDDVWLERRSF